MDLRGSSPASDSVDDSVGGSHTITPPGSQAIVPLIQVAGTVTRRAVEPTWLTASNAKVRIDRGTEGERAT